MPMNGYERLHPPGGYGLGRHATVRPSEQSAQQLAQGAGTAPAPAEPAQAPQTPAARAQAMLSQRRPGAQPAGRPGTPPAAPSLAAPPAQPSPPAPLGKPPTPAAAPSPLAAPQAAAPAQPAPAALDMYTDPSSPFYVPPDRVGTAADPRPWQADPRSNPNNVMTNFYDPTTKRGFSDFANPALRASPGVGYEVGANAAGYANPNADPTKIYTDPSSPFYQGAAKQPPIVDSIPPPPAFQSADGAQTQMENEDRDAASRDAARTASALESARAFKGIQHPRFG